MNRARGDTGNATIEFALGVMVIVFFVGVLGLIGRVSTADGAVAQAAREAARAATLERTAPQAHEAALSAATQSLEGQQIQCQPVEVESDLSAFFTPVGTPGTVSVTVSCPLDLAGLPLPWSVNHTANASATSVLDTYRERDT